MFDPISYKKAQEFIPYKQMIDKSIAGQGLYFSFDGALNHRLALPGQDVPFTLDRNSPAYDSEGRRVERHEPVYESVGILDKKGVRVSEAKTNLISQENSVAFLAPEVIALTSAYHTLSIKKGTGKLTMSGVYNGEVLAGSEITFLVSSSGDLTLTPEGGIPELVQLEVRRYSTPWQKGDVFKRAETLSYNLPFSLEPNFGIGITFKLLQDSTKTPPESDGNWRILYGWLDTDNELEFHIRPSTDRMVVRYCMHGVNKQMNLIVGDIEKNEPISAYIHVTPEGLFFYKLQRGAILVRHIADEMPPPHPDFKQLSLGCRLRSNALFYNNAVFSDFRVDLQPNAVNYFKEVWG